MKRTLFLLGALAACSSAPLQSDWERAHLSGTAQQDDMVTPPRYPRAADLVPVDLPAPAGVRFFVDRTTLSVDTDRVVRYVLVARSGSGADNVSFEGLRCGPRRFRLYAVGRADRGWSASSGSWETTRSAEVSPARRALAEDYFCADGFAVRDAGEAVAALHRPPPARQTGD